nr:unnamed protein product [Spirometra erinaceieuropaei]
MSLQALLRGCRDGFPPTRRSNPALKGYPEDRLEASANHLVKLGRPRPGVTDLKESGEDRCGNLRVQPLSPSSKPNTRFANLNCAYLATPTLNRPDLLEMSADLPCTTRTYWISSYQLQHPGDATRCPPSTSASLPTLTIDADRTPSPPLLSSSVASACAATAPAPTTTAHNPDAPTNTNLPTVNANDVYSVPTCPHCDCIFTSRIGAVGHL